MWLQYAADHNKAKTKDFSKTGHFHLLLGIGLCLFNMLI